MPTTITIDPVTRIEGHLDIEVTVDPVDGQPQVVDAKSSGTMFRGFEIMLVGRDPRDAVHYTQRICGVCPISHGMAASKNLENAFGITPPDNGRILRNLILGANFVMSHILHFYHLAALDYIDTTGILDFAPWTPRYVTPCMVGGTTAQTLVGHYVTALEMRRKSHQMGAIFGGKLPCSPTMVPGGNTEVATAEKIADFRSLLTEVRDFIDNIYIPDVLAVASLFPDYYHIGAGCGNLIAYGVFDLDSSGQNKLMARGRYTDGTIQAVDPADISEYVQYSWYTANSGNRNPADGVTEVDAEKDGAYSWLKSPRYLDKVHEAGPLARMWINGDYFNGISVLDRIAARALETKKVADAMDGWLDELIPGNPSYQEPSRTNNATGIGLTEAPRGALGHWIDISDSLISRYQVVTPTNWNASPKDDLNQPGPIEQALIGTPVADINQPIELLRVVHSFDPCLACSVHMVRPDGRLLESKLLIRPGIA
ncbi:MAG: nickel-dependent hydrogenase large subunit [Planctomycetota bacterium]|nr:MAG: nickel-dependent hydrogenase large subunit [Planctomycetota bacterium]